MKFIGLIPARYASTRFPGKPLAQLGGMTVIERVYRQVREVISEVYVCTDDQRIYNAVQSFGGKAVMTSVNHRSGTDRCYEAFQNYLRMQMLSLTFKEMNLSFTPLNFVRLKNVSLIPKPKLPR